MRLGDRSSFSREWLEDARLQQEQGRVFSAFFSGYIALVAASSQLSGDHGAFQKYANQMDEHLEREAIEFAVAERSIGIEKFLSSSEGKQAKNLLRNREVPEGEDFKMIGSVRDLELTSAATYLFNLWSPISSGLRSKAEIKNQALYLGVVFRKIRNRLFHGGKMNDPHGTDADLLMRLNPILFEVVEVILIH
jgi:hypothetical protein